MTNVTLTTRLDDNIIEGESIVGRIHASRRKTVAVNCANYISFVIEIVCRKWNEYVKWVRLRRCSSCAGETERQDETQPPTSVRRHCRIHWFVAASRALWADYGKHVPARLQGPGNDGAPYQSPSTSVEGFVESLCPPGYDGDHLSTRLQVAGADRRPSFVWQLSCHDESIPD